VRAGVLIFLQASPTILNIKALRDVDGPGLDSAGALRLTNIFIASHKSSVLFRLLQRGSHQDISFFIQVVLGPTVVMVIFYYGRGTEFEVSNALLVVMIKPKEILGARRGLKRGEHVGHHLLLVLRLACPLER
jgi:hypothetical protein